MLLYEILPQEEKKRRNMLYHFTQSNTQTKSFKCKLLLKTKIFVLKKTIKKFLILLFYSNTILRLPFPDRSLRVYNFDVR